MVQYFVRVILTTEARRSLLTISTPPEDHQDAQNSQVTVDGQTKDDEGTGGVYRDNFLGVRRDEQPGIEEQVVNLRFRFEDDLEAIVGDMAKMGERRKKRNRRAATKDAMGRTERRDRVIQMFLKANYETLLLSPTLTSARILPLEKRVLV